MHGFRENLRAPAFIHDLAEEVVRHSRCLNNLDGINGVQVTPNHGGGYDFEAEPVNGSVAEDLYPGLWYPTLQTGFWSETQDPEIIQIGYGYFIDSMNGWRIEPTEVKVTGGTIEKPSFAYLEYTHDGVPVIAAQTISVLPIPTATVYRRALVETALVQGVPIIVNRVCREIIEIDGLMGRLA